MARPKKDPAEAKAINTSYAVASRALIEAHKDEFNGYRKTYLREKHNIDWSPPLTQEQKDEAALRELLDRSPALLDHVLQDKANAEAAAAHSTPPDAHS